jgi:NADPH:quinone reductase-like Zn-dependent oxidoreductase
MLAVRIDKFGGPEMLRLDEIPVPAPREGEMLVRVRGASVNPVDYKIRQGKYPAVREARLPYVLGRDLAGEVESCGPGVSQFGKGDALYAVIGIERGTYAEHAIVKPHEAAHQPRGLDPMDAASVPLAGLTAWQGLFRHGGVKPGQRVLIHGGAGGVGHFAVQLAKARGAFVATTVSGENVAFARELGADQVIDYKKQRFEDEIGEIDMVFDLIAGETQERSWAVLKPGGILVSTLTAPPPGKARAHNARGMRYTVEESGAELAEIAALIDAGKVRPTVSKTFKLREAREAQQAVEAGHTRGKVVLAVA